MGSGTRLHYAYKKYGIENFSKEILKYFDTREECAQYEAEVVTEQLVLDNNCYNISCGGEAWNTLCSVSCIDNDGNSVRVPKNEFNTNNYKTHTTGKRTVFDETLQKNIKVDVNDIRPDINKGKYYYRNILTGKCELKNINNVDKNIYSAHFSGHVVVKDKNNNFYSVSINDERYKKGILVPIWKDRHHTQETKDKLKQTFKNIKHQQGINNSQYGKIWISKLNDDNTTYTTRSINKKDLDSYLSVGWFIGRRTKDKKYYEILANKKQTKTHWYHKIINNNKITTILKEDDERIFKEQWILGR